MNGISIPKLIGYFLAALGLLYAVALLVSAVRRKEDFKNSLHSTDDDID